METNRIRVFTGKSAAGFKSTLKTNSRLIIALVIASCAVAYVGTGYTLFDDATYVMPGNNSSRAVQLTSNTHSGVGDSGIDFGVPSGLTFSQLLTLSTDYFCQHNTPSNGAPRFQINVSGKNIFVYIGGAPAYTGCPAPNTWGNTGNLLDATNPLNFVDDSQLGGTFYDPITNARAAFGTLIVTGIQLVDDAGYAFGDGIQTILVDNVMINDSLNTFDVPSTAFQLNYSTHIQSGFDGDFINITNDGSSSTAAVGSSLNVSSGNICVGLYFFDPNEELQSCCACEVTPNGLISLSVKANNANNLTSEFPDSEVVKLLAWTATSTATATGTIFGPGSPIQATPGASLCNAAAPGTLVSGLQAWGSTLHTAVGAPSGFAVTETRFSPALLSVFEYNRLTTFCSYNQFAGSGNYGQCKGCQSGGLGAAAAK